jgi:hypothetical protein
MEAEVSLSRLQEPTSCPFSEPDQSSPCPHPSAWRLPLILSSHLHLGLPSGLIPSSLPHQNPLCSSPPYVLHAPLIQRKLVFLCRGVGASSFQRHLSADITARWKQRYFLGGKYEKSEKSIILIRFLWRWSGFCYIAFSDSASIRLFLLACDIK